MTRLRSGKWCGKRRRARRELRDQRAAPPRSAPRAAGSRADRSRPRPSRAPRWCGRRASSAPRWAALSMPRASPLTTVTPRAASVRRRALRDLESVRRRPARSHDRHRERVSRRRGVRARRAWRAPTGTAASCAGYSASARVIARDLVDRVALDTRRRVADVTPSSSRRHPAPHRRVSIPDRGDRVKIGRGRDTAARAAPLPAELGQQRARLGRGLGPRIALHHAAPKLSRAAAVLERAVSTCRA